MKLFRVTDGREVVVGDPVKFMGRPHYIESITDKLVIVISMCERRYYFACPIRLGASYKRLALDVLVLYNSGIM